jgi:hypothetical protein
MGRAGASGKGFKVFFCKAMPAWALLTNDMGNTGAFKGMPFWMVEVWRN